MTKIPVKRHIFLNQSQAYLTQIENDLCEQKYYVTNPDETEFTYLVTQEEYKQIQDEIQYLILHVPKDPQQVLKLILGGSEVLIKPMTYIKKDVRTDKSTGN